MIYLTNKNHVQLFEGLVTKNTQYDYPNHKQLKSFLYGSEADLNTTENKQFPLLMITPQLGSYVFGDMTMHRVFNMAILDLVKSDNTNILDVVSNTEQILYDCFDIMDFYWRSKYGISNMEITNIETVWNEYEDDMAGVVATVDFEIKKSSCIIDLPVQ